MTDYSKNRLSERQLIRTFYYVCKSTGLVTRISILFTRSYHLISFRHVYVSIICRIEKKVEKNSFLHILHELTINNGTLFSNLFIYVERFIALQGRPVLIFSNIYNRKTRLPFLFSISFPNAILLIESLKRIPIEVISLNCKRSLRRSI